MKYITKKIDKEKELEERISNFTKISLTNGEECVGSGIVPKRLIDETESKDTNVKLKSGDRIVHKKKKLTGKNIYSDPSFWDDK